MKARNASSVLDQPLATLRQWRILEETCTRDGEQTWHFVGVLPGGTTVRISTAIVEFNLAARLGQTTSGRVYELRGPPALDSNCDVVFVKRASTAEAVSWRDITREVLAGEEDELSTSAVKGRTYQ